MSYYIEPGYIDVDTLIEEHWPYDGPHSDQKVKDAASTISGLTRYMNNASQRGMRNAASVNAVLGALGGAAYGLDQLVDQLQSTMRHHAEDPSLYDDRRDRPAADTAAAVIDGLAHVRAAAAQLAAAIETTREHTSHLGNERG